MNILAFIIHDVLIKSYTMKRLLITIGRLNYIFVKQTRNSIASNHQNNEIISVTVCQLHESHTPVCALRFFFLNFLGDVFLCGFQENFVVGTIISQFFFSLSKNLEVHRSNFELLSYPMYRYHPACVCDIIKY